jgi:hypothetical protein
MNGSDATESGGHIAGALVIEFDVRKDAIFDRGSPSGQGDSGRALLGTSLVAGG